MTGYPLSWPAGWKRTPCNHRKFGHFRNEHRPSSELTVADAVDRILTELRLMGIYDWMDPVISTNIEPTLTGRPRSQQSQPGDPGAAVYWRKNSQDTYKVMAIDRYSRTVQNLAAIAATLNAMRAIERHGGAVILERAFVGFTALPARNTWRTVMGFEPDEPLRFEEVRSRYRTLCHVRHPDKGGSESMMQELNWAMQEAERELEVLAGRENSCKL